MISQDLGPDFLLAVECSIELERYNPARVGRLKRDYLKISDLPIFQF